MRRGINIRKKKRILLNETNQKYLKILILLFFVLIVCMSIYFSFIQNIFIKKNFEKDSLNFSKFNGDIPFSISKIILFNSATAESSNVNQSLSLDISGYCDIGIYLNNTDKENTNIKSLFIDNIKLSSPELGTPYLYKKIVSDLGKCSFSEDNIIDENFEFNIIDANSKINFSNYELSSNGSTPISLGFYNRNIKQNFMIEATEILYNGTLFKNALIPLSTLNCNISFSINIITNEDKHYVCNINLDIPYEDENGSIYDTGYITKELKNNQVNRFIRVK